MRAARLGRNPAARRDFCIISISSTTVGISFCPCSDLSESTIQAHFWHLSLLLVASGFRVRTIGESRGRAVRKIDPAEPTRWRLARGVARPANPTLRYPHTTTSRCRQVTRAHPPQRVSPASRGAVPFSLLLADCVTITFFGPAICVSPP